MSTTLPSLHEPQQPATRAPIYVWTLRRLRVSIDGKDATWSGGGTGGRQLRLMFSYLVSWRDQPVSRADLIAIARGRRRRQRPGAVVTGLLMMLDQWGLRTAVIEDGDWLILCSSPLWRCDTDDLQANYETALRAEAKGDFVGAIATLEAAARLCTGPYLPEYDALPDYALTEHAERWANYQREVLHALVTRCLVQREPTFDRLAREGVQRILSLPDTSYADCLLAARMHEHFGEQLMAAFYRARARLLLDE